jgi:hypothetical protein
LSGIKYVVGGCNNLTLRHFSVLVGVAIAVAITIEKREIITTVKEAWTTLQIELGRGGFDAPKLWEVMIVA